MIGLSPLPRGRPPAFQRRWVRASTGSYPRFALPRGSSPGFAPRGRRLSALFGLAVASARLSASPRRRPRLAGSFFNRHAVTLSSGCLRARGFRRCFTPLPGCFSPFPHGTRPLSVAGECLALEGGPPCFPPGFTCPAVLGPAEGEGAGFAYGALTLFRAPSQASSARRPLCDSPRRCAPAGDPRPQPRGGSARTLVRAPRFGLAPVRSPLLGGSRLISPPRGT